MGEAVHWAMGPGIRMWGCKGGYGAVGGLKGLWVGLWGPGIGYGAGLWGCRSGYGPVGGAVGLWVELWGCGSGYGAGYGVWVGLWVCGLGYGAVGRAVGLDMWLWVGLWVHRACCRPLTPPPSPLHPAVPPPPCGWRWRAPGRWCGPGGCGTSRGCWPCWRPWAGRPPQPSAFNTASASAWACRPP